ncbi:hypothetical protein FCV25MIE_17166 [Fagus crenata]
MVAIDRQGICDSDLSNRLLHRPCFDDRIVAIHVHHEHHPLVLLLFRNLQYCLALLRLLSFLAPPRAAA